MKKCRYIPEVLLSEASDVHIQTILDAISSGQIRVCGLAERFNEQLWKIGIPAFVEAVRAHLEGGFRLYTKRINNPLPDCLYFEANVGLYPDSNEEDDDVYVEIRLSNGTFIIICDSHPHFDAVRLPK